MTVTVPQLLQAAGAGATDTALATVVLAEAEVHIADYVESSLIDADVAVPDALTDSAVLQCATDLFNRRKAPFGQMLVPDANGSLVQVRLGSDPLGGVRAMLRRYCFEITFAFPVDDDE